MAREFDLALRLLDLGGLLEFEVADPRREDRVFEIAKNLLLATLLDG